MDCGPRLFAISDLHLDHRENRAIAEALQPDGPEDWLAVAGDVAHRQADIIDFLSRMRGRFAKVMFAPGNHDLWQVGASERRGQDRYCHLVERCRAIDVLTPEDPYPLWRDACGAIAVAPLFLLYDYTMRPEGSTKAQVLATARVVCSDELLLSPEPFPDREFLVRGAPGLHRRPPARVAGRDPNRSDLALAIASRAGRPAVVSGIRHVVWHPAHRGLASALSGGVRRLWTSAYSDVRDL